MEKYTESYDMESDAQDLDNPRRCCEDCRNAFDACNGFDGSQPTYFEDINSDSDWSNDGVPYNAHSQKLDTDRPTKKLDEQPKPAGDDTSGPTEKIPEQFRQVAFWVVCDWILKD
jgi:hypothetical protein